MSKPQQKYSSAIKLNKFQEIPVSLFDPYITTKNLQQVTFSNFVPSYPNGFSLTRDLIQ